MKLKERFQKVKNRVRSVRDRVLESGAASVVIGIAGSIQANPFPVQLLFVLVYRIALDVLYLKVISPLYAYSGFTTDLQPTYYACTLLALLLYAPFIVRLQEESCASANIITFLNYIYFIPFTSYCGCYGAPVKFFAIGLIYWAVLLLIQFRLPVLELKPLQVKHTRKVFLLLTILGAAFVMFISWRYTGLRFTLNFIDVYETRAEAASYQMPGLFSYALSMMHILLAVMLMYWLKRRKWLATGALVVVFLFYFSIAAHKSQFFFLLLVIACVYLYRPWMLRWAGGVLTIFTGMALAERLLVGTYYLETLFFRRMMYVPVRLSEVYMKFFQAEPLNLFRNGIMGKLSFDSSYSIAIPKLIGEFTRTNSSANNGILGDMFANTPIPLGLVLMPLILIVCFRLMDAVSNHLPKKFTISVCLYFAMSFSNSSWSIVLLSNGFLLACLLLYFFPHEEELS